MKHIQKSNYVHQVQLNSLLILVGLVGFHSYSWIIDAQHISK